MFLNRGFAPHDLVKALQDGVIELLLAASALRALLTVTSSADLHHITKHLMLFHADRMASQNNRQENSQAALNTSSRLLKCCLKQIPLTPVLLLENLIIFALQLCFTLLTLLVIDHHQVKIIISDICWKNAHSMQSKSLYILPPEV